MEKVRDEEQKSLVHELTQGKELVNQLRNHIQPSSSQEAFLIQKILFSYEKALSLLNFNLVGKTQIFSNCNTPIAFGNGSPRSEVSDEDFKHKDKKRKKGPMWTEKVRICSGNEQEGLLNDGYNWRKYGQKDILGAKFPRCYYRCTHRHLRGCLAVKQVQRSDKDPSIYDITYRGRHTCSQTSSQLSPLIVSAPFKKEEQTTKQPENTLFNFGTEFKVKTEELENKEDDIFPSFCFTSPSIGSEIAENSVFPESLMENSFIGRLSPAFVSPATSESNYSSACHQNYTNGFVMAHNHVQTSETDISDVISAPASVANSPILDFDFLLEKMDFDSSFSLDNLEFIS